MSFSLFLVGSPRGAPGKNLEMVGNIQTTYKNLQYETKQEHSLDRALIRPLDHGTCQFPSVAQFSLI